MSITRLITAHDEEVVSATLSNSLIDKEKNAEAKKIQNYVKTENTEANLAPENAASTHHPDAIRSKKNKIAYNSENESNSPEKARQKDTAKLNSLISHLEDKRDYNLITDKMYEQLQHWISAIQIWDVNQLNGIKCKTCIPLKVGTKPIDQHSMKEKNLEYKGEENVYGNPDGPGEVIFENGDWMCGEFKDGVRHGLGTMRTGLELAL